MSGILGKYYRLPGQSVRLPTNGAFLPEGSVTFEGDGDIPVLPMTAADELMMKNPDALMSGSAVEMLFESCVPSITSAADISAPDLDVLLLAVRVSTYGRMMEVETNCPECNRHLSFDCNLPLMLANITPVDPVNEVRLTEDIIAYLKPFTIRDLSELSRKVFDEERRIRLIEMDEAMTEDQRTLQRNAVYKRVAALQTKMMANTIIKIVVPEGEATDRAEIAGFLANTSSSWLKKLEAKQQEINNAGLDKSLPVECDGCGHSWRTTIEFDPTTFFGQSSSR